MACGPSGRCSVRASCWQGPHDARGPSEWRGSTRRLHPTVCGQLPRHHPLARRSRLEPEASAWPRPQAPKARLWQTACGHARPRCTLRSRRGLPFQVGPPQSWMALGSSSWQMALGPRAPSPPRASGCPMACEGMRPGRSRDLELRVSPTWCGRPLGLAPEGKRPRGLSLRSVPGRCATSMRRTPPMPPGRLRSWGRPTSQLLPPPATGHRQQGQRRGSALAWPGLPQR